MVKRTEHQSKPFNFIKVQLGIYKKMEDVNFARRNQILDVSRPRTLLSKARRTLRSSYVSKQGSSAVCHVPHFEVRQLWNFILGSHSRVAEVREIRATSLNKRRESVWPVYEFWEKRV